MGGGLRGALASRHQVATTPLMADPVSQVLLDGGGNRLPQIEEDGSWMATGSPLTCRSSYAGPDFAKCCQLVKPIFALSFPDTILALHLQSTAPFSSFWCILSVCHRRIWAFPPRPAAESVSTPGFSSCLDLACLPSQFSLPGQFFDFPPAWPILDTWKPGYLDTWISCLANS